MAPDAQPRPDPTATDEPAGDGATRTADDSPAPRVTLRTGSHRLGPLVWRDDTASRGVRGWAALMFGASASLLGIAVWLTPSPAGMGTHRQLGFPPCTMVAVTGFPCPTCGMTTAFAYTVRGRWLSAAAVQPAGFLLALATLLTAGLSLSVLLTGRRFRLNWYRVRPAWVTGVLLGVILLGWATKVGVGMIRGTLPIPPDRRFAGAALQEPGPPASINLPERLDRTERLHETA